MIVSSWQNGGNGRTLVCRARILADARLPRPALRVIGASFRQGAYAEWARS